MADTTPPTFAIGVTTDVGAVAGFLEKCVEAGLDIFQVLNSSGLLKGRYDAALQADQDRARKDAADALKTGDAGEVATDLS